jgi:magnesium transporter
VYIRCFRTKAFGDCRCGGAYPRREQRSIAPVPPITGALVAAIATAFSFAEFGLLLGAVIGVSMVTSLVIAGFFGAVTPLVLDRLGYDPATSATIFITTATDVLGFLVFLGLSAAVLL